jgi:hypothetical protein
MGLTALVEQGIGATRALVLDGDTIVAAHFQRDDEGPRAGAVHVARLTKILEPGRRGLVRIGGVEAMVEPLPPCAEGGLLRVEVVRGAIPEAGRPKLAKLRPVEGDAGREAEIMPGPDLVARLRAGGIGVTLLDGHGPDRVEAAGWTEIVDAARTGHVAFAGGLLSISPTPAMTVIDVDGPGDPAALAMAAATAAAAAIARFDITGSIGIDFPTLVGKTARVSLGEALDAALPKPFERTAINGWGFVQIVRPRLRANFVEAVRAPGFSALELLRRAGRAGPGSVALTANPAVIGWLAARPALVEALARRCGGTVRLHEDARIGMVGGDVATA